jgi:hypothetical protein
MTPGRTVVLVALVGLGAAGTWAWQHGAQKGEMKVASAQSSSEQPRSPPLVPSAPVSEAPPAAAPTPAEAAAAAPQNNENAAPVSPAPADVDTPEPAERKFARGAHSSPEEH